jgi:hypothetical protein
MGFWSATRGVMALKTGQANSQAWRHVEDFKRHAEAFKKSSPTRPR